VIVLSKLPQCTLKAHINLLYINMGKYGFKMLYVWFVSSCGVKIKNTVSAD